MDVGLPQMQRRLADYRVSLFREGILDSQYLELQELEDESNPGFVVEVLTLFLTDSEKLLHDLSSDLVQQNVDFKMVDVHVDRLEGGSRSIGLPKLKNTCIAFRNLRSSCQEKNIPGYLRCLEQMRQEFFLVKSKLETLLDLERQIVAAGGKVPKLQSSF
ncbi:histidine-containing phosphotransfer protein 1-like [Rhodamnia argentea]|uniref:Histidine-containing phosphotransfer protein n=1 Tax=Rhodamnia argentea TaxID=178133 RepID=A0A8B8N517_9MYRT|nr:histidine-containing phosphotransfer protein 1-like [Rhodamnia argentea]